MKLGKAYPIPARRTSPRARAFERMGSTQTLDQTRQGSGGIQGQQQLGQVVAQALQGQRAVELHAPAAGVDGRRAEAGLLGARRQCQRGGVLPKGTTIQVEQFFLGSYMGYTIHAPGGMIESISGGFVNECLE